MRPVGEIKDALQFVKRTVESRTWFSHDGVMSTPYAFLTVWAGKLSNVHIPSSASAGAADAIANIVHRMHIRLTHAPLRSCRAAELSFYPGAAWFSGVGARRRTRRGARPRSIPLQSNGHGDSGN
jgi:hypothetical protein